MILPVRVLTTGANQKRVIGQRAKPPFRRGANHSDAR
jgi:hypothetical protein